MGLKAWARRAWDRARERVPGLHVVVAAAGNYIEHQSANQAGSVAFSTVLAMFPLLLLVSAAAGFFGEPGDAAALAQRVIGYAPPIVREALEPVVAEVLGQRNQALLTVGMIGTAWAASSGMQAIRTALNRAYDVEQGLSFWKARLKVLAFTIVVGGAVVVVFSSVVVMPYVWRLLEATIGASSDAPWLRDGVRYGLAYGVLCVVYALLYGWLPDLSQRLRTVVPGALLGAAMWVGFAFLLSFTWESAGKLRLVYGGFAGLVATLVFLYLSAATLIFGAEVNAVLRARHGNGSGRPAP